MDFTQLSNKLKSIDILKMMDKAVLANKEEILDANTSQLSKGKLSNENDIRPKYSTKEYAQFKIALGSKAPFQTPNLLVTGEFYGGFYMKVDNDGYEVGSNVGHADSLQTQYGSEIFGLTNKSKSDLKPQIKETLVKIIKDGLLR